MGLLSKFFGKSKKQAATGTTASAMPARGNCPGCGRRMLTLDCPFCTPQTFGEDIESTMAVQHEAEAGLEGLAGVPVAHAAALEHGAAGFLHVYAGNNRGMSVLVGDSPVTIGRKSELNTLAIQDGGVSSRHCQVQRAGAGLQLTDVGSKNGTFVNDEQVQQCVLDDGDVISMGATRIYVGVLG